MGESRVVFEVQDWLGRPVRLMAAQWRHILQAHPEMADAREAIMRTIQEPNVVTVSDTAARHPDGGRLVLSRLGAQPTFPRLYVRVPVEYAPRVNWVTTAYMNPLPPEGHVEYVDLPPR